MKMSRVVLLAIGALSVGGSKDAASEESAPTKHKFVVELAPNAKVKPGTTDGVRTVEDFNAADKTYAVYEAESAQALTKYLEQSGLLPKKVTEVKDINSPTRGGGKAAGEQARNGQKTFVIERKIPGVGTFPDARKEAITKKSNAAIAEIGD